MSDEFLRWLVVGELSTLIACGTAWHRAYRGAIPSPLWRVGWAYGWVIFAFVGAVVLNLILNQPVTIGLVVVAVAIAPAAAWVVWCTVGAVRVEVPPPNVPVAAVSAVLNGVDHPDDGPPCTHPGCIRAREQLRRLTSEPDS